MWDNPLLKLRAGTVHIKTALGRKMLRQNPCSQARSRARCHHRVRVARKSSQQRSSCWRRRKRSATMLRQGSRQRRTLRLPAFKPLLQPPMRRAGQRCGHLQYQSSGIQARRSLRAHPTSPRRASTRNNIRISVMAPRQRCAHRLTWTTDCPLAQRPARAPCSGPATVGDGASLWTKARYGPAWVRSTRVARVSGWAVSAGGMATTGLSAGSS